MTVGQPTPQTSSTPSYEQLLDQLLSGQGAGRKNDARTLLLMNLLKGDQSASRLESIVSAPHTDIYGNKISFDPVKGWTVDATPTTKAVADAQQTQDLLGLTRDAGRNRQVADDQARRAAMGNEAFTRAFNNFQYRPRTSEDAYIGEAQNTLALDRKQQTDELSALRSREALRGGTPNDFARAFQPDQGNGQFAGILSQANQLGRQNFLQNEGAKQSQGQDEVNFYRSVADDFQPTAQPQNNTADQLTALSNNALASLISVLQGNEQSRNANLQAFIQAMTAKK